MQNTALTLDQWHAVLDTAAGKFEIPDFNDPSPDFAYIPYDLDSLRTAIGEAFDEHGMPLPDLTDDQIVAIGAVNDLFWTKSEADYDDISFEDHIRRCGGTITEAV